MKGMRDEEGRLRGDVNSGEGEGGRWHCGGKCEDAPVVE